MQLYACAYYKVLFTPGGSEGEKDQRKISLSLGLNTVHLHWANAKANSFPEIFVALKVNIKSDSLWTHLEAMSPSLSYQCKQTLRSKMYMLDLANYSMIPFEFTRGIA